VAAVDPHGELVGVPQALPQHAGLQVAGGAPGDHVDAAVHGEQHGERRVEGGERGEERVERLLGDGAHRGVLRGQEGCGRGRFTGA